MEMDKVREIIYKTANEYLADSLASDIAALATIRIFAEYIEKLDKGNKEKEEN